MTVKGFEAYTFESTGSSQPSTVGYHVTSKRGAWSLLRLPYDPSIMRVVSRSHFKTSKIAGTAYFSDASGELKPEQTDD